MSKKRKRSKTGSVLVYLSIALVLMLVVIFVSSSVSPTNADLLAELNATPTPTPTATPTPTPTPVITPTPMATMVPQPTTTPALRYAGTTVKGIGILEKSKLDKDYHIYNIMSAIPSSGLPIPRFYQFNYKTPICYFYGGRKTVSSSGCGPTCVSMITAWVKQDYDQTPYTQMYRAAEVGDYFGSGLTVDGLQHMLQLNDIVCWQEEVSEENILAALKAGRACVMRMGPGTFTRAGHYIILRGIDELGKILVNDPNSEERSCTAYDVSLIARQAKKKNFVVVGAMEEQTGVTEIIDTGVSIVTTQAPISSVSIGFATVLETVTLRDHPGGVTAAAKLERGTVLEILEKRVVSGDEKVWYGVAYNGAEYYVRSNYVAASFYELDPGVTPEPDATDVPDEEAA